MQSDNATRLQASLYSSGTSTNCKMPYVRKYTVRLLSVNIFIGYTVTSLQNPFHTDC